MTWLGSSLTEGEASSTGEGSLLPATKAAISSGVITWLGSSLTEGVSSTGEGSSIAAEAFEIVSGVGISSVEALSVFMYVSEISS